VDQRRMTTAIDPHRRRARWIEELLPLGLGFGPATHRAVERIDGLERHGRPVGVEKWGRLGSQTVAPDKRPSTARNDLKLAVETVRCEPVSPSRFPANREKNREFSDSGLNFACGKN